MFQGRKLWWFPTPRDGEFFKDDREYLALTLLHTVAPGRELAALLSGTSCSWTITGKVGGEFQPETFVLLVALPFFPRSPFSCQHDLGWRKIYPSSHFPQLRTLKKNYLFIWERQRMSSGEEQKEREREANSLLKPNVVLDPRTLESRPEPKMLN